MRDEAMAALAHVLAHGRHDPGECEICDSGRASLDSWLDEPASGDYERGVAHGLVLGKEAGRLEAARALEEADMDEASLLVLRLPWRPEPEGGK